MQIIESYQVTEAEMQSSNVALGDYPNWNSGTTYANSERVVVGNKIYQSVQAANDDHPPATSPLWWVEVGAVNRWRAFDDSLSAMTTNLEDIRYDLRFPRTLNAVAMFGLNASEVQIYLVDTATSDRIYDRTFSLVTSEDVYDAWTYFFNPLEYKTSLVVTDLPLWANTELRIRIRAPGTEAMVSEIICGINHLVGETLDGTEIGLIDYSYKERDEFGNLKVKERGYSQKVNYQFIFTTEDGRRIRDLMTRIRTKVAVYHAGRENDKFGVTIPGFYKDFNVPLTTEVSYGSLEVESLI